jgi:hypothetical protein
VKSVAAGRLIKIKPRAGCAIEQTLSQETCPAMHKQLLSASRKGVQAARWTLAKFLQFRVPSPACRQTFGERSDGIFVSSQLNNTSENFIRADFFSRVRHRVRCRLSATERK